MIAAFKGKHQALAAGIVAHQFERVLDGLRTADVEMDTAFQVELALGILRDARGELYFFTVQILRSHLWQRIQLAMGSGVQPRVAIAETDRRVPHLKIQIRRAVSIVEIRTF